jgi:hypothetical protein
VLKRSELDAQLERDSESQVPAFAATSVKLAREGGEKTTDFLLEKIHSGRPSAFIALEALREADVRSFDRIEAQERAAIYAAELRRNTYFNGWGLPGFYLTPTATALIGLREEAVAALAGSLNDTEPALLTGSEEATTSKIFGNRICDYAWVFINEIRGIAYAYSQHPADRDKGIKSLLRSLERVV